jgi:hypothetical protein
MSKQKRHAASNGESNAAMQLQDEILRLTSLKTQVEV